MSSDSGGPDPYISRENFISSILTQGNRKAGKKIPNNTFDTAFDLNNMQQYKEANEAERLREKTKGVENYGANETLDALFNNLNLAGAEVNTASMDDLDFNEANLASIGNSNIANKTQNDMLEQMKKIFDQRKSTILSRTLRPGQAATRGGIS